MGRRILILTEPGDVHAVAVAQALLLKGADPILWYTSNFPSKSCESVLFEQDEYSFYIRDLEPEPSPRVDTVWRRRPAFVLSEEILEPSDLRFSEIETQVFRRSLWEILLPGAFWVNPDSAAGRTGHKLIQLWEAKRIGLAIPDTLCSNDPVLIRGFLRRHGGQSVYKPFKGLPWRDEVTYWMPYTSFLTEEQLVDDDLLQSTPGIYQAVIPKAYELRVTFIGRRAFSAKIFSQDTQKGRLDWRKAYGELKMKPCELPAQVSDLCLRLMGSLGIVFGCFDFIVTPTGEYVFLEVNEMGQFLFVESYTGLPLLDAFSEFLIQSKPDFRWDETSNSVRYADLQKVAEEAAAEAAHTHVTPKDPALWDSRKQT